MANPYQTPRKPVVERVERKRRPWLWIVLGAILGLAGGWVLSRLMARMSLPDGLYALLILSGGTLVFAATNLLNGSGFLAVYLAGVVVGNRRSHATEHVLRVMDGLAWLAQAGMFVVLGLLVTPSRMIDYLPEALAMAVFLMLVARPLAVAIGLAPFRYPRKELLYVSWVGLRGAVPVVLAIVPVVMGVPDSQLLFNVAFAVVLLSLLVQGATVPMAARWLGVEVPPRDEPRDKREVWVSEVAAVDMLEFCVGAGAKAEGRHPDALGSDHPGHDVRCVALVREGGLHRLTPDTRLRPGDSVWMIAPDEISEQLARSFAGSRGELTANASFFGEFVVDPDSRASDLADAYGLRIEESERELAMGELLAVRLGRPPVVGDRVEIGAFVLTVREMGDKGRITALGLKCPPLGGGR